MAAIAKAGDRAPTISTLLDLAEPVRITSPQRVAEKINMHQRREKSLIYPAFFLSLISLPDLAAAQRITTDGSLGQAKTLIGPSYAITPDLGKQVGGNLFQSFGMFGLAKSESANFSGPSSVTNIIGRVTGGAQSWINGAINSSIQGANLYLVNPSGVVLGPNASVNISGSFHVSTADYVRFSDGVKFYSNPANGSTLTAAPPAAFGFMNASPLAITINRSQLSVPVNASLGIVGGPISISQASLTAPAGRIHVTSVASTGEVPVAHHAGVRSKIAAHGPVTINQSSLNISDQSNHSGGTVRVRAGALTITSSGIDADNYGPGPGGGIALRSDGALTLGGGTVIHTDALAGGPGGNISLGAATLTMSDAMIRSEAFGPMNGGGNINVNVAGAMTVDATTGPTGFTGFFTPTVSSGNAGNIRLTTGSLWLVGGQDTGAIGPTPISSMTSGSGNAGAVIVNASALTMIQGSRIESDTNGNGRAGQVSVMTGALSLSGSSTKIESVTDARGNAGDVVINAGSATIADLAQINSGTTGSGDGGSVRVVVNGSLNIIGPPSDNPFLTGISSVADPGSTGRGGTVVVTAGSLSLAGFTAEISSSTLGSGKAGDVAVQVAGPLSITGIGPAPEIPIGIIAEALNAPMFPPATGSAGSVSVTAQEISLTGGGSIASTTAGTGAGGSVTVMTPGSLLLDGMGAGGTQIAASATGLQSGMGGPVTVTAGSLTVEGGAQIASTTAGTGAGGSVNVTTPGALVLDGMGVPGTQIAASATGLHSGLAGNVTVSADSLSIAGGAQIASTTAGSGFGGFVQVTADGQLSLSGGGGIIASATSTASGNAGFVDVSAPQITVKSGAQIASTTAGSGGGGFVAVTTPGALALEGLGDAGTGIAASATGPQSGDGGKVVVSANSLTINGGAQIASSTAGPGDAGAVVVLVTGAATLTGNATDGTPSRITAEARQGSRGQAGGVGLSTGGMLTLTGGAEVTSSTAGAGNGGLVVVGPSSAFAPCVPSCVSQGPLSLSGGGGILALASATASGNAGSVTVNAPQITVTSGAEIVSTTAGTGAGGSVGVTTPGALVLDGMGNRNTQIAASATGPNSGSGGSVTVAANTLTVGGGAQIASSTAGPGKGGDVNVVVAGDITLPDRGPQITAQSTGSGDAGSITLSAARLMMSSGGAISTEAETSMANGGNITLNVRDFLYLVSSQISTSVNGETGNGGNITLDPQLAILNHSSIIAQAIEGHGGNITITADQFIPSTDSIISATSQLGISGTVVINGPRVDVNGALVVLSSELRGRAEVLREACAARGGQPISSFVEAGRGGLPQDPEATLPALYIAGRELGSNALAAADTDADKTNRGVVRTTARLTMRCS
jgi:filamentous hemagglutinin family protein